MRRNVLNDSFGEKHSLRKKIDNEKKGYILCEKPKTKKKDYFLCH